MPKLLQDVELRLFELPLEGPGPGTQMLAENGRCFANLQEVSVLQNSHISQACRACQASNLGAVQSQLATSLNLTSIHTWN